MNFKPSIIVNSFHRAERYQGGEVVIRLDPNLLITNNDRVYLTVQELEQLIELAGHTEYDDDGNQIN